MHVPEADRPAGPGVRERALAHAALATRTLLSRLSHLPGGTGPETGLDVLRAVERAAAETAASLRGATPATDAHADLVKARAVLAATPRDPPEPAALLRHRAAVLEVADATLAMSTAAEHRGCGG